MSVDIYEAIYHAYPALWLTEKIFWIVINLAGLVLAAWAAAEAQIDLEAVDVLGEKGSLLWMDTSSRRLKSIGDQRDERIKVGIHALLMVTGVIISIIEIPSSSEGRTMTLIMAWAVILLSGALIWGSYKTLLDRRELWRLFLTEEQTGAGRREQKEARRRTEARIREQRHYTDSGGHIPHTEDPIGTPADAGP